LPRGLDVGIDGRIQTGDQITSQFGAFVLRQSQSFLEQFLGVVRHNGIIPNDESFPTLFDSFSKLLSPRASYAVSSFFFTRTTVIFANPSSNVGGFSFAAIRRITSSGTTRSRRWWRSMQTSSGTSKNTACTS